MGEGGEFIWETEAGLVKVVHNWSCSPVGAGVADAGRVGGRLGPKNTREGARVHAGERPNFIARSIELGEPVEPAEGDSVNSGAGASGKGGNKKALVLCCRPIFS